MYTPLKESSVLLMLLRRTWSRGEGGIGGSRTLPSPHQNSFVFVCFTKMFLNSLQIKVLPLC